MMVKQTKGRCRFCAKEFTRAGIIRHLDSCKSRAEKQGSGDKDRTAGYFELMITDRYLKEYWLVIDIEENMELEDLDSFIRDIWVECCGHLSAFRIDGVSYDSPSSFGGYDASESMQIQLNEILYVGQVFEYYYDFGSTTELIIAVKNYRRGPEQRDRLTLLARNNPPQFLCSTCGKEPAVWIDLEHYDDEKPFICGSCLEARRQNEDGDEAGDYYADNLLPVCNSPRMGV